MCPLFMNIDANVVTMTRLVGDCVKAKAELVVFPELCTTGYSFMDQRAAEFVAEDVEGHTFQRMKLLSKTHNLAIVWGFVRKDSKGRLYNSQTLVTPEGGFRNYDKRNPFSSDFLWMTPGEQSPAIIKWRGVDIGLLICKDVRDAAEGVKDLYEPGDAHIVAFSANWGKGGFPSGAWVEFAKNNKTWLAVSNRYGREVPNDFGDGGVCFISPEGKVFCGGLKWGQDCVVTMDIPDPEKA